VPGTEPRYVLRVIPDSRQVVIGPAHRLAQHELSAESVCWTSRAPDAAFAGEVRIRSHHAAAKAEITPTAAGFHVRFREPQNAVAPGQAAVVYVQDRVIGGGYITDAAVGAV
jgi:tRNA-specific 2-thiouridylase